MRIIVGIQEIHFLNVELDVADNATREEITQAAEDKANDTDSLEVEYSHTLDQDDWTVRDSQGRDFGEEKFGLTP